MHRHLAQDFAEFGRSGRQDTRSNVLATDISEIHHARPLRQLRTRRLGGGVVLVTYQSDVDGLLANRRSIWRLTNGG